MINNSSISGKPSAVMDQKQSNGKRTIFATRAAGGLAAVAIAVLAWGCPPLHALVRQMNLTALSKNADAIVRATVMDIEAGSIRAGGGNIPTIT